MKSSRRSEGNTVGRGSDRAKAGLGRPSSGTTTGSGVLGLGEKEDGAEVDLEPVDARGAVFAGFTGGTAWGVAYAEGLGGPSSAGAGAPEWFGADRGGTATVSRRPNAQSAVARGTPVAATAR